MGGSDEAQDPRRAPEPKLFTEVGLLRVPLPYDPQHITEVRHAKRIVARTDAPGFLIDDCWTTYRDEGNVTKALKEVCHLRLYDERGQREVNKSHPTDWAVVGQTESGGFVAVQFAQSSSHEADAPGERWCHSRLYFHRLDTQIQSMERTEVGCGLVIRHAVSEGQIAVVSHGLDENNDPLATLLAHHPAATRIPLM